MRTPGKTFEPANRPTFWWLALLAAEEVGAMVPYYAKKKGVGEKDTLNW